MEDEEFRCGLYYGFAVGLIISGVLTSILMCHITANRYKSLAVEHGCAEYNSETGEWQWKDIEKNESGLQ